MTAVDRALAQLSHSPLNRAEFISVTEAASILNRSLRTIRYWEKDGHMPPRKRFGKKLMYRRQDVEELALLLGGHDA